ncbi:hypothetical protein LDO26_10165 [Luteimonas sp. BDR2-5]|uniref:hypothetical protein n=1 Tax=Proluteimonas luteida TaxID=2878685 RepID=UPI001E482BA1|nr:hypothetical protein [Luteimonas sp. BDR2-5]MCD9028570.1 hypothetical protein [Luteimonas sp. BDR2-5]
MRQPYPSVPDAKRLKELESENTRLKKLLAEQMFENDVIKDGLLLVKSGCSVTPLISF